MAAAAAHAALIERVIRPGGSRRKSLKGMCTGAPPTLFDVLPYFDICWVRYCGISDSCVSAVGREHFFTSVSTRWKTEEAHRSFSLSLFFFSFGELSGVA